MTIYIISSTSCCLIISSKVYSFSREGEELTSISQHFKLVSMKISYPNSSKQLGFWGIVFIQEINDFRMIYYICFYILTHSIPLFYNLSLNIFSVILQPPRDSKAVIYFFIAFYLFMLKLVKWMNLLSIRSSFKLYFYVLNLANPYL